MKTLATALALTAMLATSLTAEASSRFCAGKLRDDAQARESIEFLKSIEGRYRLGSCMVELHACDEFSPDYDSESGIADILITDGKGFERYVPIYFPSEKNRGTTVLRLNYSRAFHYEFLDRVADPYNGKYENFRLEIVKNMARTELKFIEIGFRSQREKKNRTQKSWIICGGLKDSGGRKFDPLKIVNENENGFKN